jgi:hypothetical protein
MPVPRADLWRAYTPQAFRLGLLRHGLAEAEAQDQLVTDDASAVELLGRRPALIEGHADNIKITRPDDLPLAAFYLERSDNRRRWHFGGQSVAGRRSSGHLFEFVRFGASRQSLDPRP